MLHLYSPGPWLTGRASVRGSRVQELLGTLKVDGAMHSTRNSQCHAHVGDCKGVQDELPAAFAVLVRPIGIGLVEAVACMKKPGAAVAQRVNQHCAAAALNVIFKLRPRTVDVPRMVQQRESLQDLLVWCPDKLGDVCGTQEAMTSDVAHDLDVALSDLEYGRRLGSDKPWPATRNFSRDVAHIALCP